MKTAIAIITILIILTSASAVSGRGYELPDFYSQSDDAGNTDCSLKLSAVILAGIAYKNDGLIASAGYLEIITYKLTVVVL